MSGHGKTKKSNNKQLQSSTAYYLAVGQEIDRLSNTACDLTGPNGDYAQAYPLFEQIVTILDREMVKTDNLIAMPEKIKANALSNMGMCCLNLNQFEQAKKHLEQSIKLNPNDQEAQLRMARAFVHLGLGKKANDLLEVHCKTIGLPTHLRRLAFSLFVQNAIKHQELDTDKKILELRYQLALRLGESALQPIYLNYLAQQHYKKNEFDKALEIFSTKCQSLDLEDRIDGLYHSGLIKANKEFKSQDIADAITCFQAVIQIYQEHPQKFKNNYVQDRIALSAHSLAKFFDDGNETLLPDTEEALKYYNIGAELNHPECLHDLAYKYENGEDVAVNLAIAENYYKRAADLNYTHSILNLGSLLIRKTKKNDKEGIKWLKLAATNPATARMAYHNLGIYYLELFLQLGRTDKTSAETAFRYFQKAAQHDNYNSIFNLGTMLYFGTGIDIDEKLAIQYFNQSAKGNSVRAYLMLINIYLLKLSEEKDAPYFDSYATTLSDLIEKSGLFPNLKNLKSREIILSIIKINPTMMKESFIGINEDVIATAKNIRLKAVERLKIILSKDITVMNTFNICTVMHRVGALTEKSLDERDFHHENLPKILCLLNEILKRIDEKRFNTQQVTNLIEGISKLHLKANLALYVQTIEKLYIYVLKNQDDFNPQQLVNIIYASSRLDSSLVIFREILLDLIKKALQSVNKLNAQSSANLLYCQAILNYSLPSAARLPGFKQLVSNAIKTINSATHSDDFDEKSSSLPVPTSMQLDLHQIYLSLYYFSKQDSEVADEVKAADLEKCLARLDRSNLRSYVSKLQNDVVEFLSLYLVDPEIEKDINTLPVDAYFEISDTCKFILQVDGPSHFLHGEDDLPIPSLKTKQRDAFLTASSACPVISIPYYVWDKKTTTEEKFAYLAQLLFDEIGIRLQKNPLEKTSATKLNNSPRFFSSLEGNRFFELADLPSNAPSVASRPGYSLNFGNG